MVVVAIGRWHGWGYTAPLAVYIFLDYVIRNEVCVLVRLL
jgi:hypothetical protein